MSVAYFTTLPDLLVSVLYLILLYYMTLLRFYLMETRSVYRLPSGVFPPTTTTTQSPFAVQQKRFQEEYARRALLQQQTALLRAQQRQLAQQLPGTQLPVQASPTPRPQQSSQKSQPLRFVDPNGQVRQQNFLPRQQDFIGQQQQQQQDFVGQQQEFVVVQQNDFAVPPRQVFAEPQQQEFVAPSRPEFVESQQQEFTAPSRPVFAEPQQQEFVATSRPVFAGLQQQEFAAPSRQVFAEPQQKESVVPRRVKNAVPVEGTEPFSYAEVHFGTTPERNEPLMVVSRPKGQRSVSRPTLNHVQSEPVSQQTIDHPATVVNPVAQFNTRQLQNVVYIQPNGQIYKPTEETEPVVQIPRQNHHFQQIDSSAATSASSTTAATIPAEEEPVIVIPRPKKPVVNQRPRHEGRKAGSRAQQQQRQQKQDQQQQQKQDQQQQQQQSPEVEPDNFLSSLLGRLQQQQLQQQQQLEQQQQQTVQVVTAPRTEGSSRTDQRPKSGSRAAGSKYLADKNQLQLLQFPHELKALSGAELRVLEQASAQIAVANDKSVERKHQHRTTSKPAVTKVAAVVPPHAELDQRPVQLQNHNRPVPTPVELNEQQRQFLATQGIRNLYRVDYDQAGNELPLTYVLALDNKRPSGQPTRNIIE